MIGLHDTSCDSNVHVHTVFLFVVEVVVHNTSVRKLKLVVVKRRRVQPHHFVNVLIGGTNLWTGVNDNKVIARLATLNTGEKVQINMEVAHTCGTSFDSCVQAIGNKLPHCECIPIIIFLVTPGVPYMANWSTSLQAIQQTLCPLLRKIRGFKNLVWLTTELVIPHRRKAFQKLLKNNDIGCDYNPFIWADFPLSPGRDNPLYNYLADLALDVEQSM